MQINLTQFKLEFDLGLAENYRSSDTQALYVRVCLCVFVYALHISHELRFNCHRYNVLKMCVFVSAVIGINHILTKSENSVHPSFSGQWSV